MLLKALLDLAALEIRDKNRQIFDFCRTAAKTIDQRQMLNHCLEGESLCSIGTDEKERKGERDALMCVSQAEKRGTARRGLFAC